MLSQAKMVRRAIESQYTGTCTVTEHQKIKKGNGSTGFTDSVVLENEPCRLSFATSKSANSDEVAVSVTQSVKVFLSPDIVVKPGSKMTITQNGRAMDYKNTGKPAVYDSHQEISLELFEGWA